MPDHRLRDLRRSIEKPATACAIGPSRLTIVFERKASRQVKWICTASQSNGKAINCPIPKAAFGDDAQWHRLERLPADPQRCFAFTVALWRECEPQLRIEPGFGPYLISCDQTRLASAILPCGCKRSCV